MLPPARAAGRRRRPVAGPLIAGSLVAGLLAGCGTPTGDPSPAPATPDRSSPPSGTPRSSAAPEASGTPGGSAAPGTTEPSDSPTTAPDELAGWSLEQKVGQLLMVGVAADDPAPVSADAVTGHHVGNVFLHGRSDAGVDATRGLVDAYTDLVSRRTTRGTPMLVATDQEGGQVQVLSGPGFSTIPAATEQATWGTGTLQRRARGWGDELADAGVNLNLAPVMDLVDADTADANAPIGHFDRNYGFTPASVTTSANAFAAGMRAAGVEPVIKHFPGLGRVRQNTDTDTGVTDTVTGPGARSVDVFADGIDAGARYVMVSSAVYERIDPDAPAVFSPAVIDGLLRDDLGFDGVVVTDDLSAATQVSEERPGRRAVRAVEAGADLVLASADPSVAPAMADALVAKAREDPAFAAKVDESARRVVEAKRQG